MRRAFGWLRAHLPELLIVAVGVAVRLSLHFTYPPMGGYDAGLHWEVIAWMAKNGGLPPLSAAYCAYHPPLYYALSALLVTLGGSELAAQWLSIVFGVLKLGLIWLAVEWYLKPRAARLAALALAAILPAAVHMDGMITNEPPNVFFAVAAMLFAPKAFEAEGRRRWVLTTVIGVLLSLQLMSKISALMCIAAIGIAVLADFFTARDTPWRARIMRALPWSMVLVVPLVLTGWYFGRNVRDHGKPFIASYDVRPELVAVMTNLNATTPYLDRRKLGFVFGWSSDIFTNPYQPTAMGEHSRFVPQVVAMTYVDYWNYRYAGLPDNTPAAFSGNYRPVTEELMIASRRSAVGGTILSLAIAVAWVFCCITVWRRREWGLFAMLVLPALTLLSGLHFAIKHPFDHDGVVKSSYLQFGMNALYGAFGVAVAWTLARRRTWPLFTILMFSLWAVTAYTIYARLRLTLLPF